MKILLVALSLAAASACRAEGFTAGQFESYTLALSWEPAFCEGKPGAKECAAETPDRFDASNLVLHGLWPDKDGDSAHAYGDCGVSDADRSLDRAPTWCRLPAPELSEATRKELTAAMPGVASCLERHEWTRHGTCSGLEADEYFARAAGFVRKVAKSEFGRYLSSHAGQTVERSAVIGAFEKSVGAGREGELALNCADVRGTAALIEARLRLTNPLPPASAPLSAGLERAGRGNCPSSFLLDPVAGR